MAAAAPSKIRVPVSDGERWQVERTASRSDSRPSSRPLASHRGGGSVSRLLAPFLDLSVRVSFWLAVALPAFYLPLVLAPGTFDWPVPGVGVAASSGAVVVTLAAFHLAAVVVGHGYARHLT